LGKFPCRKTANERQEKLENEKPVFKKKKHKKTGSGTTLQERKGGTTAKRQNTHRELGKFTGK